MVVHRRWHKLEAFQAHGHGTPVHTCDSIANDAISSAHLHGAHADSILGRSTANIKCSHDPTLRPREERESHSTLVCDHNLCSLLVSRPVCRYFVKYALRPHLLQNLDAGGDLPQEQADVEGVESDVSVARRVVALRHRRDHGRRQRPQHRDCGAGIEVRTREQLACGRKTGVFGSVTLEHLTPEHHPRTTWV